MARELARLAAGLDAPLLPSALPARLFEAQAKGPPHDPLASLPGYVCSEHIPEIIIR